MQQHRVLSIQSHVVYGYVGNKSATFPLQINGFEVDPLHTVQFNNHTGYGSFTGMRFDKSHIDDILQGLQKNGNLKQSHVLVGYVGKAETLEVIATWIAKMKHERPTLNVLIDPVLGDDGKLYCQKECIQVYKTMIGFATVITPNEWEARWLTDMDDGQVSSQNLMMIMMKKLLALGPSHVIITSADIAGDLYLFASKRGGPIFQFKIPIVEGKYTGTGDLFAALLLCQLEKQVNIDVACCAALSTMSFILKKTVQVRGGAGGELAIIQCAQEIANPPQQLFEMKIL